MSEFRLNSHSSSEFLAQFDPEKIKIGQDAVAEIVVGPHQFEISFPIESGSVKSEHIAVAREVLAQVTELDAAAMQKHDGVESDGELFVIDILSGNEIDLRYSAVSWNSDWREMFRREHDGRWVHHGWRKPA